MLLIKFMHKFSSNYSIRRIRLAALLLGAKYLLSAAAAGVLLYSLMISDQELANYGLVIMAAAILAVISQWMVARRASCPLCMTSVLARKGCAKHRTARPLLGSHRLRVAFSVLFLGRFRCPYCGEASLLQVREGRRR